MVEPDGLSLEEAACWYAARGLAVFPCQPRGKQPLVPGGFHAASKDLGQIQEWWRRWPAANIGLATGAVNGLLVVDIDPRHGGDHTVERWIASWGRWPETAEVVTGSGGRHVYFRHREGVRSGPLAAGVDVKSNGGYVICPPSVHACGQPYRWDGLEGARALQHICEPPGWLLHLLQERQPRHSEPLAQSSNQRIPRGRRNTELASIAGVLRARGADEATLVELLSAVNRRLCEPPLDEEEVVRIARSVARYEPRAYPEDPTVPRFFELVEEGRYRLSIPGIATEMEVDQLRRENGSLWCELGVRCWLPGARGVDGVLTLADFNLSSPRARLERARLIAARAGTKGNHVDWVGLVEELAQRTMLAEREGTPAIALADLPDPQSEQEWRLEGLALLQHHPTVLFGDGGACKSYLGLWWMIQLARRGVSVLYLDWELDEEEHRRRLGLLGGLDCRNLYYLRCSQPLTYELERIRRAVRSHEIRYLVLDSAGLAADGPPESAEVANRYFRALRRLGCGSLTIAHVSKAEDADRKPFGSTFWHNCARATFFVKRSEQVATERVIQVGVFNRKSNLGPLRPPVGYQIRFEQDRTLIRQAEIADQPEFASQLTLAQRMAALLRGGPLSVSELAEQLDTTDSYVRNLLTRKARVFTRLPDGRVALRAPEIHGDQPH